MRKAVMAGAGAAAAAALLGGAALYYFKEKATEEPDFRTLRTDGDFQVRGRLLLTSEDGTVPVAAASTSIHIDHLP